MVKLGFIVHGVFKNTEPHRMLLSSPVFLWECTAAHDQSVSQSVTFYIGLNDQGHHNNNNNNITKFIKRHNVVRWLQRPCTELLTAEEPLELIKVFSRCRNESTDDAETTLSGSAFRIFATAAWKKLGY